MTGNSSDFVESYNWTSIREKVAEIKQTTVRRGAKQCCPMWLRSYWSSIFPSIVAVVSVVWASPADETSQSSKGLIIITPFLRSSFYDISASDANDFANKCARLPAGLGLYRVRLSASRDAKLGGASGTKPPEHLKFVRDTQPSHSLPSLAG